jgi:hypothetical protein
MDSVLARLTSVFVYLDEIIVASKSLEQHEKYVEEVFRCLRSFGLVINGEKCKFAIQFLGHHVTAEGIQPLPYRVATVQDHPKPFTVKQLQAFLVVVNFGLCWSSIAAEVISILSMATPGIFLKEVGTSTN